MKNSNISGTRDFVTTSHPLDRAHQLLTLLSDDELLDAVAYLEDAVYGSDEQPDEGDNTEQDLDDDVENLGLLGTGEEEPDAGVDSGSSFEPDDPSYT